jgi:L-lactate dehydrogenase complex protein LldG
MNTPNTPNTPRDEFLRRVRSALHTVPREEQPADVQIPRAYQRHDEASQAEIVERFIERTIDYKAMVHHIKAKELPKRIAQSCAERGVSRLVLPPDLPEAWLSQIASQKGQKRIELLHDDGLSSAELEQSSGVLTGCALAIAQTGTIVLDSGAYQGRRVVTLLPDYHLCVVYTDQIVGIVPEAIARLGDMMQQQQRPLTFISGPSATSDIELNRVEGVHGPRTLEVLVVEV